MEFVSTTFSSSEASSQIRNLELELAAQGQRFMIKLGLVKNWAENDKNIIRKIEDSVIEFSIIVLTNLAIVNRSTGQRKSACSFDLKNCTCSNN